MENIIEDGILGASGTPMDCSTLSLHQSYTLDASRNNCYAFSKGSDIIDGSTLSLGNMLGGYPFTVCGIPFHNSECAYIAGLFGTDNEESQAVQIALMNETNGFMAKKNIRRFNEHIARRDYADYRIEWMLYVVWCKCVGNADFRNLLLSLPANAHIIEDSTNMHGADSLRWGMKNAERRSLHNALRRSMRKEGLSRRKITMTCDALRLNEWRNIGTYEGQNAMGRILMLCRDALRSNTVPPIDAEFLRSKHLYWFGLLLTFDSIPRLDATIA